MNIIIAGFNGAVLLLVGLLYTFTPDLVNRYLLFGVTVTDKILQDAETADVKKRFRLYTLSVCFISIAVYVGLILLLRTASVSTVFPVVIILELVLDFIIYLSAHNHVKHVKKRYKIPESGILTIETQGKSEFSVINSLWYILYLVLIAGTVLLSLQEYSGLPAIIATHFTMYGTPDGFMHKSYYVLLLLPATMFLFTLLFAGINTALKRAKKVSGAARGKLTFNQENRFRHLWSIALYLSGMIILGILFTAQMTIIKILSGGMYLLYISLGGTFLMILLIGGLAVYTGQSGSRLKSKKKTKDIVDRDNDSFWKGGILYFNREDPSIFVNKRFGIGFTINFGHPLSWIIIAAVMGIVLWSIFKGT